MNENQVFLAANISVVSAFKVIIAVVVALVLKIYLGLPSFGKSNVRPL